MKIPACLLFFFIRIVSVFCEGCVLCVLYFKGGWLLVVGNGVEFCELHNRSCGELLFLGVVDLCECLCECVCVCVNV